VIGGSYAGSLTGWFRFKYPHLAIGAISSSGTINPLHDFYEFMLHIQTDLKNDEACYNSILNLESYV